MADIKLAFANDLKEITRLVMNQLKKPEMSIEETYLYIMGANQEDIAICYDKIVQALPNYFFMLDAETDKDRLKEIKEEIVKSFILFMSQEDILISEFDDNFINFIYTTISEVSRKYQSAWNTAS